MRDLLGDGESGEGYQPAWFGANGPTEEQLNTLVPKFLGPEYIHIVVAGSEAGKFSTAYGGWVLGPIGSNPVSRRIED